VASGDETMTPGDMYDGGLVISTNGDNGMILLKDDALERYIKLNGHWLREHDLFFENPFRDTWCTLVPHGPMPRLT
jgi:hypothetical protein